MTKREDARLDDHVLRISIRLMEQQGAAVGQLVVRRHRDEHTKRTKQLAFYILRNPDRAFPFQVPDPSPSAPTGPYVPFIVQLEAWKAALAEQPALFDLKTDC
jgi:hypothetical protein